MDKRTRAMIIAALMLALSWLMPYLALLNPAIAKMTSPMHIPVFLCGFLCGLPWGPIVGFLAPLLRSLTTGMPALYPTALAMAFELATYGLVTAILSRCLPDRPWSTYLALVVAMLLGRFVWGGASLILYRLGGASFTWEMFMAGAFTGALPGIAVHIVVVPAIILTVRRKRKWIGGKIDENTVS